MVSWLGLVRLDAHAREVPVIAVFTKFEAFRHDIRLDLEDSNDRENVDLEDECKRRFEAEYLSQLHGGPKFVCLEGEPS